MPPPYEHLTKEWFEKQYIENKKTFKQLHNETGISISVLWRWAKIHKIKAHSLKKDLTNQRFGKLLALEPIGLTRHSGVVWKCLCDCGNETKVIAAKLIGNHTKSCGHLANHRIKKKTEVKAKSPRVIPLCGEIWKSLWERYEKGAKKRNIDFSISIEYAWDLFLKQDRKCELSVVEIVFSKTPIGSYNGANTASLDRIDSTKGYIEGNIQWIHKHLQFLKQATNNDEFINWCKLISLKHHDFQIDVSLIQNKKQNVFT